MVVGVSHLSSSQHWFEMGISVVISFHLHLVDISSIYGSSCNATPDKDELKRVSKPSLSDSINSLSFLYLFCPNFINIFTAQFS